MCVSKIALDLGFDSKSGFKSMPNPTRMLQDLNVVSSAFKKDDTLDFSSIARGCHCLWSLVEADSKRVVHNFLKCDHDMVLN